jgi:hypothetical protein
LLRQLLRQIIYLFQWLGPKFPDKANQGICFDEAGNSLGQDNIPNGFHRFPTSD